MIINDKWTAQYTPYDQIQEQQIFTNQDDGNYYQLLYINYKYYLQNMATLEIKNTPHSSDVDFKEEVLKKAFGATSHLIVIPQNRCELNILGDE